MKNITYSIVLFFVVACSYSQSKSEKETEFSKEVVYKVVKGDTLKLQIYNPTNFNDDKEYPTIVFFFGGGWNGGSITQFKDQALYFSTRGMISVLVDYRVKSRHGTTPFEAVKDAKSAMRFLKINAKQYCIDTNKLVASGGSAGGHLAAATSLLEGLNEVGEEDMSVSSKANALILYNPVIDNGPKGYGYERIGERYLEISPMHNIKKGAPPTIFFLGTEDKHIPVSTAENYKAKMEAVGNRCDVFIYKDQPHGFFNKRKKDGGEHYIKTTREVDVFLESIGFLNGKPTI